MAECKHLLDRIHMEATNAKQQGLNEILKKFTEMVDANASRLADPDGVKRYLHSGLSNPFHSLENLKSLESVLEPL